MVCNTRTNTCRQGCWQPAGGSILRGGSARLFYLCLLKQVLLVKGGRFQGADEATCAVLKPQSFAGQKILQALEVHYEK
jgi:hypothetical protein